MTTSTRKLAFLALLISACGDAPDVDLGAKSERLMSDDRYVVTYKSEAGRLATLSTPGRVALELPARRAVAMHLAETHAAALRGRADVESVELDARRYPLAETVPYGVTMVQADMVPDAPHPDDPRVKVCIIDSGLRASHEDLAALPVQGTDDSGSGKWNEDNCGHGTHVAGTIAAVADNGVGVVGVAPEAVNLHIVKVFSGPSCGWAYSSNLVAALDTCRAAGAKVVSMSLGGTVRSNLEEQAFNAANTAGVLSIAAAGNDGNTRKSYPASYPSVVSVAAVDQNKVVASFSQRNNQVDVAAPGVGVRSTYVVLSQLTVGSSSYEAGHVELAPYGNASGALVNGGLCDSVGRWNGRVVLCERGTISFFDKVHNAQLGGAAGVAIYNNVPGDLSGTLGAGNTSTIPAVSLSQEVGQNLVANSLGQAAALSTGPGDGYASLDGTSMATPHVSGVAALVWAQFPAATNKEIRNALLSTAEDLGAAGRDDTYGFGLVRAGAAYEFLTTCSAVGARCTSNAQCCTGTCSGRRGATTCQ